MNILEILPIEIFKNDIGQPVHDVYIKSGNCYEHYYQLSQKYKPKSILEIGVRFGYSLSSMVAGSLDTVEYVEAWDMNAYEEDSLSVAKSNVVDILGYKGKHSFRHTDSHSVKKVIRKFDLVSIDGDHSYEGLLQDLELLKHNSKVMIIDDYTFIGDVKKATDDFISNNSDIVKNHYLIDSVRGTYIIEFK